MTKLFKEIRAFVKSGHTKPLIRRERESQREGEREISIKNQIKGKETNCWRVDFVWALKIAGI